MKNKYIFLLIVFILLFGLLFIIYKTRSDNEKYRIEETRINAHNQYVRDSIQKFEDNLATQKRLETEINKSKIRQQIESEKFLSNINSSITNSNSNTDVCVTIIDEDGNISSSVSSAIANIYMQKGKKSNPGLLRNSFIKKKEFQELYEGGSAIISRLELIKHTDYLALGKINYSMRKGELVGGTIICNASIDIRIISAIDKTLLESFSFSVNGNGVTESQAKEYAIQKLIDVYYSEHSAI
ncbi:MAG: hypothetical protein IPH62_15345 [Ignavibacteriae bacterium]|nr:hypothetical protein [Ignavibacteriota bacterium]